MQAGFCDIFVETAISCRLYDSGQESWAEADKKTAVVAKFQANHRNG